MSPDTLIRVHRDQKDVGYFTPKVALECLQTGILRPDDWAFCQGLSDWMYLGRLLKTHDVGAEPTATAAIPPKLPIPPLLPVQPPSMARSATAPQPYLSQNAKPKRSNGVWVALMVGLAIFVLCASVLIGLNIGSTSSKEASISVSGLSQVPVAVDEASLDALTRYARSGDNQSKEALINSGRAFRVPNGTAARVVQYTT